MDVEVDLEKLAKSGEMSTKECLMVLMDSIKREDVPKETRKKYLENYVMFLRQAEERFRTKTKITEESPYPALRKFYGDYFFQLTPLV